MILLAVDPSLRSSGVALFRDGKLIAVDRLRGLGPGVDRVARCREMARDVEAWACKVFSYEPGELAVEWPQVYRASKSKGDPNDLLGLAGVCAAVAARFPEAVVRSFLPDEWEPCPKVSPARRVRGLGPIDSEAFTSPRGLRIMGLLDEHERGLVPRSHDAVDAVGIGMTAVGRLKKHRVFAGAV